MDADDISGKLKKRRLEVGLSLSQLARRVNTSPATLSRYENGWDRFELYTLRKLATALGCRLKVELEPLDANSGKRKSASDFQGLQRLFWDRKLRKRDMDQYPLWVLERVLEFGSLEDVNYLVNQMGQKQFLEQVALVRFKSVKTENFWRLILEREGIVPCIKRFSRKEARTCWSG